MSKIYKSADGQFYKMLKPVGSWRRAGCEHYALWQNVELVFWFFWIPTNKPEFWLEKWEGLEEYK